MRGGWRRDDRSIDELAIEHRAPVGDDAAPRRNQLRRLCVPARHTGQASIREAGDRADVIATPRAGADKAEADACRHRYRTSTLGSGTMKWPPASLKAACLSMIGLVKFQARSRR